MKHSNSDYGLQYSNPIDRCKSFQFHRKITTSITQANGVTRRRFSTAVHELGCGGIDLTLLSKQSAQGHETIPSLVYTTTPTPASSIRLHTGCNRANIPSHTSLQYTRLPSPHRQHLCTGTPTSAYTSAPISARTNHLIHTPNPISQLSTNHPHPIDHHLPCPRLKPHLNLPRKSICTHRAQ
jgi:hypothetical protein